MHAHVGRDRVYCFQEGRVSLSGAAAGTDARRNRTPPISEFSAWSDWIDTIIQGVLLGGLYSLYATGLSVIFGIMRLVNLAHGDLIVLGAFLILALTAPACR